MKLNIYKNQNIKNIIFDLGDVILPIDLNRSIKAFEKLGFKNIGDLFSKAQQPIVFDKLEKGEISENEFVTEIKKYLNPNVSSKEIIEAWNLILLDFNDEIIKTIQKIKLHYNIYLLSNTCITHYKVYNKNFCKKYNFKKIDDLFTKAYFSHEVGLRKPSTKIFDFVLNNSKLIPEETLFIDDSIQHIKSAQKLKINTIHLTKDLSILNFFE